MNDIQVDQDVTNLCNRKLWDIVRLSAIVSTDADFLVEVMREINRRDSAREVDRLRRYLSSSALIGDYGRETPITRQLQWLTPKSRDPAVLRQHLPAVPTAADMNHMHDPPSPW